MSEIFEAACESLYYTPFKTKALIKAYSQSHRAYHNVEHIERILTFIKEENLARTPRLQLTEAALWHDYYYPDIPTAPGVPEYESIKAYLEWCDGSPYKDQVDFMILASTFHQVDQHGLSDLTKLFLDFDISSFASPHAEEDSENVCMELSSVYGMEKFLVGNRAFMRALLKRKSLYYVKTEWEAPAREFLAERIETVSWRLKHDYDIGEV